MTVTTVLNGQIKIVLTPETELEKNILKSFQSVYIEQATDNLVIMNKPMPDSLVFISGHEKADGAVEKHKTEIIDQ